MKKDSAKTGFELKFKLRMPPELAKWLVWLLMGGTAVSAAAAHWIKYGQRSGRKVRLLLVAIANINEQSLKTVARRKPKALGGGWPAKGGGRAR